MSCDGQGLYQTTPTQIQRLSLIKHNQLNYPASLPDVFVEKPDPQPASRGFLNIFKQGLSSVDRDDMFGVEAAGKAWRSTATRDELMGDKHTRRRAGSRREGETTTGGGAGGATNAFQEAREKLDQRGKDLSQLEERTQQLETDAADFVNVAHLLAEKHRKKRLF